MTPPEPDEVGGPAPVGPQRARPWWRSSRWLVVAVLVVAAGLGLVFGALVAFRGRSLNSPAAAEATVRPTFVVAVPASPAPNPTPTPVPSLGASPVPSPSVTQVDEYVVAPGDTLRSIAERAYGDPAAWSRIYDANRAAIGDDPDAIAAGTRLRIPRP